MQEGVILMDVLTGLKDPRKPSNGTRHDFLEILVMTIAAVLSDCDTMEDVVEWSRAHEGWLRRFMVLKHGIASEDTFLRIFQQLDPKGFESCFRRWVSQTVTSLSGTIAVDGKRVGGSGTGGEQAIHMVSAFANEFSLVLGQEKVASKSNEITAIPELLEALYLKDFLVSIDAMGYQKAIARLIIDKKADYLLAVKGSQPGLLQAIQDAFADQKEAVCSLPTSRPVTAGLRCNAVRSCRRRGLCLKLTGRAARSLPGLTRCARSRTSHLNWNSATTSARVRWHRKKSLRRCVCTGRLRTSCIGCWTSRCTRIPARFGKTTPRRVSPC